MQMREGMRSELEEETKGDPLVPSPTHTLNGVSRSTCLQDGHGVGGASLRYRAR